MRELFLVLDEDLDFAVSQSERFSSHRNEVISAILAAILVNRLQEEQPHRPKLSNRNYKAPDLTPTEFFANLRPIQDIDKVLSAAYFLNVQEQLTDFTSESVKKCLLTGKIPPPANISLGILANARKGFLAQSEKGGSKRNSWFITQSGLAEIHRRLESSEADHEKLEMR